MDADWTPSAHPLVVTPAKAGAHKHERCHVQRVARPCTVRVYGYRLSPVRHGGVVWPSAFIRIHLRFHSFSVSLRLCGELSLLHPTRRTWNSACSVQLSPASKERS